MNDEQTTYNEPAYEPLPTMGGSYRRAPDGSLIPLEGPLATPTTSTVQE